MDRALTCLTVPSVPFYAKAAFVLQEDDAVSAGKVSRAALDRRMHLIAQIADGPLARCVVEGADVVIGVREDDPALVGGNLPVPVQRSIRSPRACSRVGASCTMSWKR